jgi:hypothetical protein
MTGMARTAVVPEAASTGALSPSEASKAAVRYVRFTSIVLKKSFSHQAVPPIIPV